MVQAWWAAGLALPAILVKSTFNTKGKAKAKEEDAFETRYVAFPLQS